MDVWSNHNSATGGYYKCNRYDPAAAPQDTDAARAKAELDRYLHYYQRYGTTRSFAPIESNCVAMPTTPRQGGMRFACAKTRTRV